VYVPGGFNDVRVAVLWYTLAGALISTVVGAQTAVAAQTWVKVTATFVAPATAAYAAMAYRMAGATPATPAFLDEVMLVPTNGTINGTSTVTTLTWVRLSASFVATSPWHVLSVSTVGAVVGGQVYLDAIQHEPGFVTPSPWSRYGPTIYGTFTGFVERWPSTWNHQGTYGIKQLTCVDAFAPMARQDLLTEYRNSVMAKTPAYYWPLSSAQGTTSFTDISGNNGSVLSVKPAAAGAGAGSVTAGTVTNIVGDPSGAGIVVAGATSGNGNTGVGLATSGLTPLAVGSNTATWAVTISAWIKITDATTWLEALVLRNPTLGAGGSRPTLFVGKLAPSTGYVMYASSTAGTAYSTPPTTSQFADGLYHHFVAVWSLSANTMDLILYVDGLISNGTFGSTTATTQFGSATPEFRLTWAEIAGYFEDAGLGTGQAIGMQGSYAHVAIWNRGLSSTEIADLYAAGAGYPGEASGTRIARYQGYHYMSPTVTETGSSVLGVSQLAGGAAVLDASQAVVTSENGVLYVDGRGFVSFQSRGHRYLETAAKWVFGERTELGEIPYMTNIALDFDPTQVYNDVQVTNTPGSAITYGGTAVQKAASQLSYGKRTYSRTVNVQSALEAQDAADWLATGHFDAHQRMQSLTINPGANPAIFHAAMAIRIGDRVTVNRRTSMGWVNSADFFIERIEHARGPGKWQVTYQMSPFTATRQPWILDDPTYSVLDSTTVLGY
jgi:hypothetical protein